MRVAKVIGQITLSRWHPLINGAQWKIVVPLTEEDIRTKNESPQTEELVMYDELSAAEGHWIALSEGAEAAMPFFPNPKPIDAYNAALIDAVDF